MPETAGAKPAEQEDWKRTNFRLLVIWVVFWGAGIVVTGSLVLHQPVGYLVIAVLLVFVFAMVNGISLGIVDQNPISSAFVYGDPVGSIGLKDPAVGLWPHRAARIHERGCDMQQDRPPVGGSAPTAPSSSASGRRHCHGRS